MTEQETYYNEKIELLIDKLKSQVSKNMEVINREVETGIGEDKLVRVLQGRRLAVIHSIKTLDKIVEISDNDKAYKKEILPTLILKIKEMVDINLKVIDIDIDENADPDDYKVLTEDKYINVVKARDMASDDVEFALKIILELENELNEKETEVVKKKSWAKVASES